MCIRLAIISVILVAGLFRGLAAPALAQTFQDRDWNTKFKINCPLPVKSGKDRSVFWSKENGDRKLAFRLRPGDIGGCPTDSKARNHAPYWERAEVRQIGALKIGRAYDISFSVQLPDGFTGAREGFFQVHGWAKGCPAYPPIMLKFNAGQFELNVLRDVLQGKNGKGDKGEHRKIHLRNAGLSSFRHQARHVRILLDLRTRPGRVQLMLDGKAVAGPLAVEYAACATPYVKFGIYRPGQGRSTSVAVFDDLVIKRVK